ncbi:hypothetical protein HYG86_06855 [Alkalicella caledoniensis]|uniref:Uncharacterized protein n=1 Tax=Alkalicella caledoniensis TaxID=2731377 RepID=A0A7G9W754_ALKCA|nr:hypothetical protein [Alkalicella caledoniensis]QNO14516.1 hypothetical protein HYG86_06855 [Alkalicella caledoniensis]
MFTKATIILLFAALYGFQAKTLFTKKFYMDLFVVTGLYGLAFYYAYSYANGTHAFNPLDIIDMLFEGISEYIFMDILGVQ